MRMQVADQDQLDSQVTNLKAAVEAAQAYLENQDVEHTSEILQVHINYIVKKIDRFEKVAASISRRNKQELYTDNETEEAATLVRDLQIRQAQLLRVRKEQELKQIAEDKAAEREAVASRPPATPAVIISKPPLPVLQIPRFSGDPLMYRNFITTFDETVHKNDGLVPSQKLVYLQSFVDGDAKKLISKIIVSDDNYQIARDILKENFGHSSQSTSILYERLDSIQRSRGDPFSLRDTYAEVESTLKMLEALGVDVNGQEYFHTQVLRKWPFALVKQLVRSDEIDLAQFRRDLGEEINLQVRLSHRSGYDQHLNNRRTKPYPDRPNRAGAQQAAQQSSQQQASNPSSSNAPQNTKQSQNVAAPSKPAQQQQPYQRAASSQQPVQRASSNHQNAGAEAESSTQQRQQWPQRTAFCPFCRENHHAEECQQYATAQQRIEKLGTTKCCKCFRQNHEGQPCIRNIKCKYCPSWDHNRALCPVQYPDQPRTLFTEPEEESTLGYFMTLLVRVTNPVNQKQTGMRLMIDQACNTTIITHDAACKLGLWMTDQRTQRTNGMGDCPVQSVTRGTTEITIQTADGDEVPVRVRMTQRIADDVAVYDRDEFRKNYPQCKQHFSSIPPTGAGCPVDILLGTDNLLKFLTLHNSVYVDEACQLLSTKWGHLIMAERPRKARNPAEELKSFFTRTEDVVKLMWDLDLVGLKNLNERDTECEERALEQFYKSIKLVNGRYEVHWPWRTYPPNLNENFGLAIGRLRALLKKLSQNEELLYAYHKIINEQIEEDVVEDVPSNADQNGAVIHYIPHHAIVVMEKSTPVRVVMDAKATTGKAKNLNENILKGTKWLGNTVASLVRFRKFQKAVTSDVYHAFHQISIAPQDRDAVRFLWVHDPSKPPVGDNLRVLRFKRVAFGIVASPFLLYATIQYHLKNNATPYSEIIAREMYADNLLVSLPRRTDMVDFYQTTKRLFQTMSMDITKWKTNDVRLDRQIPIADKIEAKETSVLGLAWDAEWDTLSLRPPKIEELLPLHPTKRIALKIMASIFDPLGWINPFVVWIRKFLRKCWDEKLAWDDNFKEENMQLWKQIVQQFPLITTVRTKRMLFYREIDEQNNEYELHTFVDASSEALGCVAYLRNATTGELAFVMAKSRLAPSPKLSIPRLEFCALLLGVRMQSYLISSFNLRAVEKFVWSDSKCVLAWISSNKILPVAVEKHLQEISNAEINEFRYVPTDMNPADVVSRGALLDDLLRSSWLDGPEWLRKMDSWPQRIVIEPEIIQEDQTEQVMFVQGQNAVPIKPPFSLNPQDFSEWKFLLRRTAHCIHLLNICLKRDFIKVAAPIDYKAARILWLRWDQRSNGSDDEKLMEAVSHFKKVQIVKDEQGIVRCVSRLQNTRLPWDTIQPIVLVKGSRITELIVMNIHVRNFHSGTAHTLAVLRKEYWLVHGRREVYRIINKCCMRCKINKTEKTYEPPEEPPLPEFRVTETSHPFQYIGIDVFGHMWVYAPEGLPENEGKVKRWVLLFTCLVTRAVHFEILEGMDTLDIISAIKRFISRRGTPTLILSDNAPQFHLVNGALSELWKNFSKSDMANAYFAEQNIVWRFTPEGAPWMGGAYERLVQVTKLAFKKTYGEQVISEREFLTTIIEIEGMMNSRPIVYVDQHLETPILTPNHFLRVSFPAIPVSIEEVEHKRLSTKQNVIECWKASERHMNYFWRIWSEQYLLALGDIHRRIAETPAERPKVGDIVLMVDPNLKRGYWKKAVIERLILSADGKCRSAQIRINPKSRMIRPIVKLIPINFLDIVPSSSSAFSASASSVVEDADLQSADEEEIDTIRVVSPSEVSS